MTRRTTLAAATVLAAVLTLAGCGSGSEKTETAEAGAESRAEEAGSEASSGAPELKVSGAYMPQPVMDDMAGGFLTVKNTGGAADKLTSVTSDLTDDVSLHETVKGKMRHVKSLDIPAGGELKLNRGGNHIMFMNPRKKPAEGDKVSIELHFDKSKPIKVEMPVKAINYDPRNDTKK